MKRYSQPASLQPKRKHSNLPSAFPFRSNRRLMKNANIVDARITGQNRRWVMKDVAEHQDDSDGDASLEMQYTTNAIMGHRKKGTNINMIPADHDHSQNDSYEEDPLSYNSLADDALQIRYNKPLGSGCDDMESHKDLDSGQTSSWANFEESGEENESSSDYPELGGFDYSHGRHSDIRTSEQNTNWANFERSPDKAQARIKHFMSGEQRANDDESIAEMHENRDYAQVAGLGYCNRGDVMFRPPNTPSISLTDWVNATPGSSASRSLEGFSFDEQTVKSAVMSVTESVMESSDEAQLRLLAAKLTPEWSGDFIAPTLARRLRDFQFAQEKRRKKYGENKPWGILGLYEHLTSIREDIAWAEDAAWRRTNGLPYLSWSAFDDSKKASFKQPLFTYFLLFLCTVVIMVSIGVNGWKVEPLSVNPMIGPSAETLIALGAKYSNLIVNESNVWRLVTPMFLHAGLIHFIFNMMALWFVGSAVESIHGFAAASIIFTISAIGGTLLSAIFLPQFISVGASGGIFGLIGSCLADIVMNWHLLFSDFVNEGQKKRNHVLILVLLVLDIGVNTLLGMTPFVDNFTHIGGMVFGFLCGMSTMERLSSDFFGFEQSCPEKMRQLGIRFLGLIISALAILAGIIVLFQGDGSTTPCTSCSYLSCVPFPPWAADTKKWWFCDDCGNVSADAKLNPNSKTFDELDLNCPDGEITRIFLGDKATANKHWLESNLPTFCRMHCENVLSH